MIKINSLDFMIILGIALVLGGVTAQAAQLYANGPLVTILEVVPAARMPARFRSMTLV